MYIYINIYIYISFSLQNILDTKSIEVFMSYPMPIPVPTHLYSIQLHSLSVGWLDLTRKGKKKCIKGIFGYLC